MRRRWEKRIRHFPDARTVMNGLSIWVTAEDGGAPLGNSITPPWRDLSGVTGGMTDSGVVGSFPTYNITDGRPSMGFDGTNDDLVIPTLSSSASDWTLITVINPEFYRGTEGEYLIDSPTGRLIFAAACAAGSFDQVGWYDGSWHQIAAATTGIQLLSWVLGGDGNGRVYRNGSLLGSATAYTQKAISGDTRICSSNGATGGAGQAYLQARVSWLAIWQRALSDAERTRLERALGDYYGLRVA